MKRRYSQKEVEERMSGRIYANKDDWNIFQRNRKYKILYRKIYAGI